MKAQTPDHETLLELGIVAVAAILVSALLSLIIGGALGRVRQKQQHAAGPPERGSIEPERHRNVSAPAPR